MNLLAPTVLLVVLAPAAIGLLGVGVARRWRDEPALVGLAIAAGWLVAFVATTGWPHVPPREVLEWVAWGCAVVAVAGCAQLVRSVPVAVRRAAFVVLLTVVVVLVTRPLWRRWSTTTTVLATGLPLLAAFVATAALEVAARHRRAELVLVPVLTASGALVATCVLGASARLAQLAGGLAATVAGVASGALVLGAPRLAGSPVSVLVLALTGIAVVAGHYADASPFALGLIALTLSAGFLGAVARVREWPRGRRWALVLAAALLPALAAVLAASWPELMAEPAGDTPDLDAYR